MKCPVCSEPDLMMTDRHGIEIDYCPRCRGVWLDRGELDKIIERSVPKAPESYRSEARGEREASRYSREEIREDDDYYDRKHRKKRGGFLGELFDFD